MQPAKRSYFAMAVLFFLMCGQLVQVSAQDSGELPKVVLSGLEAYKAEGPEAAVRAWLKGSPIDGSREALSQANVLRQIQDFYGSYQTYQIIRTKDITGTTRIIYMSLDFEKGPLFGKFAVYRSKEGWILTYFTFNTKEDAIIPNW